MLAFAVIDLLLLYTILKSQTSLHVGLLGVITSLRNRQCELGLYTFGDLLTSELFQTVLCSRLTILLCLLFSSAVLIRV